MKYKVGDVLRMRNDPIDETFTIVAIQQAGGIDQYVLHNVRNDGSQPLPDFALDVTFVDSNPDWYLASGLSIWAWAGIGGGVLAVLLLAVWAWRRSRTPGS